jgi:hypothetical protein
MVEEALELLLKAFLAGVFLLRLKQRIFMVRSMRGECAGLNGPFYNP